MRSNARGRGSFVREVESSVRVIKPLSTKPLVMGNPKLIHWVIRTNVEDVRQCYETRLKEHPGTSGKVKVKFVISATGGVAESKAVQTTTNDGPLDECIVAAVRTWMFPKPKGGGTVIVTYPFVFRQQPEGQTPKT